MKEKQLGGGQGFVIEQTGPNGWSIIGAGGLIGIALVIMALALYNLANWAGIALIIVAVGQAAFNVQRGAALIIEARNQRSAIEGAIWREVARQQRLPRPGPKAREDIKRLWDENMDR